MGDQSLNVRSLVEEYVNDRESTGRFIRPNIDDALAFLVTEVGEAVEANMRRKPDYMRNNPTKEYSLGKELADVVFMAFVCAMVAGEDLYEQLRQMARTTRTG